MNDDDHEHSGRPYGGVGIIIKEKNDLIFNELNVPSDRVLAVGIQDKRGKFVNIFISCYLSYFDKSNRNQTDTYIETLDAIGGLVDEYGSKCSFIIGGDFTCSNCKASQVAP